MQISYFRYYGKNSLEASNCYFLMGVYYVELGQYERAMACF